MPGTWYNVPDTAHSVGGDWTHTFSTNWLNQIRYSFQQTSLLFQSGAQPNCTATTPGNCTSTIAMNGSFSDTSGNSYSNLGFGYADNIPQGRRRKGDPGSGQRELGPREAQHASSVANGTTKTLPNPFLPYYNGGFTFSGFNSFLTGAGNLNLGNGPFTSKFTEIRFRLFISRTTGR